MTRDEAVARVKSADRTTKLLDEYLVDSLVALGMLKLDEPKSAEEVARTVIEREVQECNMIRSGSVRADDVSESMLRAFDQAGLKIGER